mmetsp:Transcript_3955/g.12428  ORF Transcript_3955/g.12428 Transcript_3955/m.12428 type:complete len:210 (+) Transcript_3955:506-1135(+)
MGGLAGLREELEKAREEADAEERAAEGAAAAADEAERRAAALAESPSLRGEGEVGRGHSGAAGAPAAGASPGAEELAWAQELLRTLGEEGGHGGGTQGGVQGPAPPARSGLLRKVNELVGNLCKQEAEIDKIVRDSNAVRRETNAAAGALERCYAIAEDKLFRAAKKYPEAKEGYKLLVEIHEGFAAAAAVARRRAAGAMSERGARGDT